MPDLFDLDAAREARDEAIERVDEHAEAYWRTAALDAVRRLAESRELFTTDAVWFLLRDVPPPHEERALGAVMQAGMRLGWVEPTERTSNSVRPKCHSRPLRVWRSLLFGGL